MIQAHGLVQALRNARRAPRRDARGPAGADPDRPRPQRLRARPRSSASWPPSRAPPPAAGQIGGHDLVGGRDAVRRLVALVGHSTHLYDDLTARENLAFSEALAGRRPDAGPDRRGARRGSVSTARPASACARPVERPPAAASPWPGRCFASPGCCCSTRRSRGSTRTAPSGSRTTSTPSRPAAAPRSWSPTASAAPWPSPTGWRSSPGAGIAAEATRASLTEEALQRLYLGATDASA